MRIGLLSIRDATPVAGEAAPALRSFGGLRLIDRQLDLALDLGCSVIACLADGLDPAVLALQHRAEAEGARFLAVRDARKLVGIGSAADEILVLAAGLLPDEEALRTALERPTILTLPAETGVPLGYERIDAADAWAGAMLVRASLVEQLALLPEDTDVNSALLRLALQSGTRRTRVGSALFDAGEWQLAPDQAALDARAARWVHERAELTPFTAPGQAAAERAGVRLTRDLMGRGGAQIPNLAGLAAATGALAGSAFELPLVAVAAGFVMAIFAAISAVIDRVIEAPRGAGKGAGLGRALRWMVDPVLAIALTASAPEADGWLRFYVPALMLLVLNLAARNAEVRWRPSFDDRVLLAALFIPAAVFGLTQVLAAAVTIIALLALLRVSGEG